MIVIKGLKISEDQIKYIFPRNIEKISKFKYLLPMRTLLKEEFQQLGLPNFPYYQTKRHMRKQVNKSGRIRRRRFRDPEWKPVQRQQVELIEIFCRYCSNTLTFAFDERERCFKLKTFSVEHIHGRDKDQHEIYKQLKLNKPKIYTWGKNDEERIQQEIDLLVTKLEEPIGASQDQQEAEKPPNTFAELLEMLKKKNYFVYFEPQNFVEEYQHFPDVFMFISPSMKYTYLKYHYCVGFDYTFSLIREEPNRENSKQYLVGTISGLNQFRRLSIFALVVSTRESVSSTATVFTQFFNYMGDQPRSIVTDQSPGIIWGLRKLQNQGIFQGEALWDTFHTLKNYKMANPPLKQKMRLMIREKCKYSFQKMYLQAITLANTEQQLDSLHRFMYESQKYCISQINPVLVGMGVSNSQNQFVNSLIKNIISYEKKYVEVMFELSKFIEQRNNMNHVIRMPNINIQQGINRKDLKLLRLSLNIRYLSFFFTQYFRLINVNLLHYQQDKSVYFIQDRMNMHRVIKNPLYNPKENESRYSFEHKEVQYKYKCSCEFRQKTGIPCEHILKVTTKNKDSLLQQIHPKYVIKDPSDLIKCVKSANKSSDYNVPINKRGTWSSGRMLETYYVDKNSLQNQRKSSDPRLIQPLPKGYLPALEQRNKIRNVRLEHQQIRKKWNQQESDFHQELRKASLKRLGEEGGFAFPEGYAIEEKIKGSKGKGKDFMFDEEEGESRSMMNSSRMDFSSENLSDLSEFSRGCQSHQQQSSELISMDRQDSEFSKFSDFSINSEFSRNSMKSVNPKKSKKSKRGSKKADQIHYIPKQQAPKIPNSKISQQIKINEDDIRWDEDWGADDQMIEQCNYVHAIQIGQDQDNPENPGIVGTPSIDNYYMKDNPEMKNDPLFSNIKLEDQSRSNTKKRNLSIKKSSKKPDKDLIASSRRHYINMMKGIDPSQNEGMQFDAQSLDEDEGQVELDFSKVNLGELSNKSQSVNKDKQKKTNKK